MYSLSTLAQTTISGGIYTNTTWTVANSPYLVTDTTVLFQGLILTIQPGVVVKLAANAVLEIRGTLVASGTITDSIKFTSSAGNPSAAFWEGVQISTNLGGNATVDYCIFEYAHAAISVECCWSGGPVTINTSSFRKNSVALAGYAGWDEAVDGCNFSNNIEAIIQADKTITNCTFTHNLYGLYNTERIDVYDSYFCGNNTALLGGRGDLQNTSIINNGTGVEAYYEGFYNVSGNTIAKNDTGIVLGMYDYSSPGIGTNNTICGNYVYNVVNSTPLNIAIPNNCWCDTDPTTISQKIYDGYDNISLGVINYTPYMACDASAMPADCQSTLTGIEQPVADKADEVSIFPNPFSSQAFITFSKEQKNATICIMDVLGNVIKTTIFTGKQFIVDKGELLNGIYIVQITDENKKVINKKIIIQ